MRTLTVSRQSVSSLLRDTLTYVAPATLLAYALAGWLHSGPLLVIFGVLLWGVVPGFYVVRCLPLPAVSFAAELMLGAAASFTMNVLALVLLRGMVPFTEHSQVGFMLLLNLAIYLAYLLVRLLVPGPKRSPLGRGDFLILAVSLVPLALFFVRYVFNPYLVDQDGALYVSVMNEIRRTGVDGSFLGLRRAGFTNAVMSLGYSTHLDFLSILKIALPGYIWFVLGLPVALLLGLKKRRGFLALLGLMLLGSAAFASSIDRVKPEIIVFLLWFPLVLLFYWTVSTRRPYLYLLGLPLAYLSFRSHDTGAITLLSYLLAGLVLVVAWLREHRQYLNWRNAAIAAVVLLPYLILFNPISLFYSFNESLRNLPQAGGVHFRWWFLNDYVSGGVESGWPSWTFVLFYIFNGIAALGVLAFVFRSIGSIRRWSQALALPLISLVIYFLLAEVLPRFGFYFLPDRCWVHFFFDTVLVAVLAAYAAGDREETSWSLPKWVTTCGWLSVTGGALIGLVLTVALGSTVTSSEQPVISKINSLPSDATILSTQAYNDILVDMYGQRRFVAISLPAAGSAGAPKDGASLVSYINAQIDNGMIAFQKSDYHSVRTQVIQTVTDAKLNGALVSTSTSVLSDTTVGTSSAGSADIAAAKDVYLLYSFAKTDGLQTRLGRASWVAGIDLSHRSLFATVTAAEATYKDTSSVLIHIR